MILDCELYEELHPEKSCKRGQSRTKRNAIRARKRLWTSRIVPYKIPSYMSKYHALSVLNSLLRSITTKTFALILHNTLYFPRNTSSAPLALQLLTFFACLDLKKGKALGAECKRTKFWTWVPPLPPDRHSELRLSTIFSSPFRPLLIIRITFFVSSNFLHSEQFLLFFHFPEIEKAFSAQIGLASISHNNVLFDNL